MKDQIIKRDIKNLLHFTDKRNLKSILNKGLIPRKTLESDQVHFFMSIKTVLMVHQTLIVYPLVILIISFFIVLGSMINHEIGL